MKQLKQKIPKLARNDYLVLVMNIKSIRNNLDITQEQMARLLGVHPMTVSKWERGLLEPNYHNYNMLYCFNQAYKKDKKIGKKALKELNYLGVGRALFVVLNTIYG